MWYRIVNNEIADRSAHAPKLPGVSNAGPAQLAAAGWCEDADLPAALRPQIDAEAAAAEAARIGDLAAQYGQLIGTLAQALAAFGLSMPLTAVEALPQVYAQYKADASKGPEVDLLQSAYAAIQGAGLADDDIYAVARAIGVAE